MTDHTTAAVPYEWAVELMTLDQVVDECSPAMHLRKFLDKTETSVEELSHAFHEHQRGDTLLAKRNRLPPNIEQAVDVTLVAWRHVIVGDDYEPSHRDELQMHLSAVVVTLHQLQPNPDAFEEARVALIRQMNSAQHLARFVAEHTPAPLI